MRSFLFIFIYLYSISAASIRSMLRQGLDDFSVSSDDSPELAESKKHLADMEKQLADLQAQKSQLENDVGSNIPPLPSSEDKISYDDLLDKAKGKSDLYDILSKNPSLDEIEKIKQKMTKKSKMSDAEKKAKEDAEFEASLDASLGKLDNLLPPEERARLSKLPKAPSGPGHWESPSALTTSLDGNPTTPPDNDQKSNEDLVSTDALNTGAGKGHWAKAPASNEGQGHWEKSPSTFKLGDDPIINQPDNFEEDSKTGAFHFKPKSQRLREKDDLLGQLPDLKDQIAKIDGSDYMSIDSKADPVLSSIDKLSHPILQSSGNFQNADRALIQVLKNKNIYGNLPPEIRNLMKSYENQYDLNMTSIDQLDPIMYFETNNQTLSPSSQPFIDNTGRIGRRGFLTTLNATTLESNSVWIVLNSKVFCIYTGDNNVSIDKLIRISQLKFSDIMATPCFTVFSQHEENNKTMLCAPSISEKEIWLQAFTKYRQKS